MWKNQEEQKKNEQSTKTSRIDGQVETSTNDDSRRRSAKNGPISSTLSKRPRRDVLPTFCLIRKVPGPIWITDKVLIKKKYLTVDNVVGKSCCQF